MSEPEEYLEALLAEEEQAQIKAELHAIMEQLEEEEEDIPDGSIYVDVGESTAISAFEALQAAMAAKNDGNLGSDTAYPNPIDGWYGITNNPVQPLEITEIPEGFSHQTLVIIDVSAMSPTTFMERMKRFVGGLNTPDTMKANVVTVTDGKMYAGLTFTGDKAGGLEVPYNKQLWNAVIRVSEKDIV